MKIVSAVVKRCKKLAFYGVPNGDEGTYTFYRMKGFDDITTNKNPREYSRQYVDEEFEQTDVVGYNPSISFGFDRFSGDSVHDPHNGRKHLQEIDLKKNCCPKNS